MCMSQPTPIATATAVVREHLDTNLTVTDVAPLHGGMINRVEVWTTAGRPEVLVAKCAGKEQGEFADDFMGEFHSLRWFRAQTTFPVPWPYACGGVDGEKEGTFLLMEMIPGSNLGEARLTPTGRAYYQRQLADILADLHDHKREMYGSALMPEGTMRWLDIFTPWAISFPNRSSKQ